MSGQHPCNDRYRELISRYIDGELDADERQDLLAHLSTCDECRETLEAYRSIGSRVRSMPPIQPPTELRRDIYADTIEARPRRMQYITSRVGYSLAAVAAVLLVFVVAVYLLVAGYQQSFDPEVSASNPNNNVVWPLHRPIEVSFSKEMNRESVEAALSISPASEKERLNITWDDNTLIIGQNQLLKPGSSYSLSITQDAEDRYGNQLGQPFSLQFETSSTVTQLETPEVAPSPTEMPAPTATEEPATPTPTTEAVEPTEPEAESTGPGPGPEETVEEGPIEPTSTPEAPAPQPTSEPTATPVPPTPTPAPTETPTPEAPTPSPTSTPTPTPVPPTPTPTEEPAEPTATPTPDEIPVTDSIGHIYWGQDEVRNRLGEPAVRAVAVGAVELDFQHGAMILRRDQNLVYVLEAVGVWSSIPFVGEDLPEATEGTEEGTWEPGGPLGLIWSNEVWVRDSLGYALEPDGREFETSLQTFERGVMLQSASGQVYVLYDDGSWELYSDPEAS